MTAAVQAVLHYKTSSTGNVCHIVACSFTGSLAMQATLQALLQRLAIDHPFHSLYQIFALKNGNRGKDGQKIQAGDVYGGMSISVDRDKVAAATQLLRAVASHPSRSLLPTRPCIATFICVTAVQISGSCFLHQSGPC